MKILALDMSSTTIGACYDGCHFEMATLKGEIDARCQRAATMIGLWLAAYPDVDMLVIESPVARFAKAVIPQARVSGAVLAELSRKHIAWVELPPQAAKMALVGKGNAKKEQMIAKAHEQTGRELNEHQADAYGLWLAGRAIKVESRAA